METSDGRAGRSVDESEPRPGATELPTISAYSTSEERTVFTESDNGDGWIATDLTVDPVR